MFVRCVQAVKSAERWAAYSTVWRRQLDMSVCVGHVWQVHAGNVSVTWYVCGWCDSGDERPPETTHYNNSMTHIANHQPQLVHTVVLVVVVVFVVVVVIIVVVVHNITNRSVCRWTAAQYHGSSSCGGSSSSSGCGWRKLSQKELIVVFYCKAIFLKLGVF